MLLALCGTRLVGKTTFLWERKDELANSAQCVFHVTFPDDGLDYQLHGNEWWAIKGNEWHISSKELRISNITAMAADRGQLWVMDATRYLNGLTESIVPIILKHRGIKFLIVETTPTILRQYLIEAGELDGNWANNQLMSECTKHSNAFINYYRPLKVPGRLVFMNYDRGVWEDVYKVATQWISDPISNWYYNE
jgi:tRNA uridine 5-carbamoylmethylation protein Kti12